MLKSLELFGFKSFADKTRFDFHPGITGVVGPNGSGKSNVVDGIKWILGDQSPKSLRGKEMTDVIFNGAVGRKPNSFAEATLTFDNSNGLLPLDSQEVQIGRRLWRNGDAEYLINRAPARLRDIRELFMGTGAGSAAYSIIEQGRVDQILQANASARRAVFEEAAGISLYKSRKTDAVRRLQRVDQNLQRLTDIVDEVEGQLNSTRSQAAKAAKYREVSTELRELWLGLAADDYRHHAVELSRLEASAAGYASELETLNQSQQEFEQQLAALDLEISEVDDRLRAIERKRASNRETMARHESTIRHETIRSRELDAEVARLRKQRSTMAARTREVLEEMRHNRGVLEDGEREHARGQADLARGEAELREIAETIAAGQRTIEQSRQQLLERMRDVSAAGSRATALEGEIRSVSAARQGAETRREQLDRQIADCRAECERRRLRVEEAATQITAVDDQVRELREQREQLLTEHEQFQKTLAAQREQRSAMQARKSLLDDLEQRQEGIGIGVKEILSRAATSDYPPWNRILGSVADLLEADLEQAALLEVALGSRAQLIVVEEFEPLLEYLGRGATPISGRVGFVAPSQAELQLDPETGLHLLPEGRGEGERCNSDDFHEGARSGLPSHPNPLPEGEGTREDTSARALEDLSGQPGVLMRADALVRACPLLPGLPAQLLADTWVVESTEVALQLAAGAGRGCRFVTPVGEMLEADGSLIVGTVRSETSLVSRKSELRRLKNDLLRLDRKIADEERRITTLSGSLTQLDEGLREVQSQLLEVAELYSGFRNDLTAHEQELERLRRSRDQLAREIEEGEQQEQQLHEALATARTALAQAEGDLRTLELTIEEGERDVARLEQRETEIRQQRAAEELAVTRQEERLTGLRTAFKRLEQDQQQRTQQLDEAARRLDAVRTKQNETVLQILNGAAVLAECCLADEAIELEARAVAVARQQRRGQRARLVEEESRIRKQRRELIDRQHQDEMRIRDIRTQTATFAQRIEEEYQVSLEEVVESGASAMRLYLDELRGHAEPQAVEVAEEEPSAAEVQETTVDDVAAEEMTAEPESAWAQIGASDEGLPTFEEARAELEERVNRLRRKLKHMGAVNTDSLDDLDELETRYDRLKSQLDDLLEAKSALEEIIRRINIESKRLFTETFDQVRGHFQHLFRKAFGGGDGDIVLEDPNDVLECGIDIVARPPGKELKSITLMSGGEKTLTAFALLLAIFKCRPSPYCVLDEVDAALDEANVERLTALLQEFEQTTQFIVITHKKPTMTICDVLYGVTMEQSGVSKRMSVRFEDVNENGDIKASAAKAA